MASATYHLRLLGRMRSCRPGVQCSLHALCHDPLCSTVLLSVLFSVCLIRLWVAWEQAVTPLYISSPSHVIGTQYLFNEIKIKLPQ